MGEIVRQQIGVEYPFTTRDFEVSPMRLGIITLFAFFPFATTHARPWQPEFSEEICDDGIDNDGDGWIDQESPQDDGFYRYNFVMEAYTNCTEYPGQGHLNSSCSFDETVEIDPHKDRTFSFSSPCGHAGTLNVEAWALKGKKGKMFFDVWSEPNFDSAYTNPGTLCDGELSGPDDESVWGGSGTYWIGDYEQFGWTAECVTGWKIDVVPLP